MKLPKGACGELVESSKLKIDRRSNGPPTFSAQSQILKSNRNRMFIPFGLHPINSQGIATNQGK